MGKRNKLKTAIDDTKEELAEKEKEVIFLKKLLVKLQSLDAKKDNGDV